MTAFPMTESLDDLTPVTHPVVDLPSQAALLRQVFEGADIVPLIQAELDRLHHDLTDAAAYVSLSLLYQLTGDRENGLACLEAGLHYACLFRQPAPAGALRLLTICAQGDLMTNTPVELLLEGLPVQVTRLYVDEVGGLPEMIPEHDVALFAIGEAEQTRPALARLQALPQLWDRPLLNSPAAILDLSRDRLWRKLDGVPGLVIDGGVVKVDANMMTGHPGIFAGGDMVSGERTVTVRTRRLLRSSVSPIRFCGSIWM